MALLGGYRRIVLFGIALSVLVFLYGLRFQVVTFQTDGIIYADTARQIATGHGLSTRVVHFNDAAPLIPQTNWPPLYPALASILLVAGMPLQMAMKLVPLLVYAVGCALLGAYLLRRFGWLAAVLFSALILANTVLLNVAAQPLSEGVFFGLSAVALFLTDVAVRRLNRWPAIGLGLVAGAAADTRVLGLGLFPSIVLALCLFRRWRAALLTSLGFLLTALPLYLRNYDLRRYNSAHPPSDSGLWSNIIQAIRVFGNDLLHSVPGLILSALSVIAIVFIWRKRADFQQAENRDAVRFILISIILGGGLLAGTVAARSITYFDVLYTRFIAPVEFFLWPSLAVLAASLVKSFLKQGRMKVVLFAWFAVVAVSLVRHFPRTDLLKSQTWVQGERITWVQDHLNPDALYVGNRSPGYTFFLNRTALALRQATTPGTHEGFDQNLTAWLARFPAVYLIIEGRITTEAQQQWVIDLAQSRNIPANYRPIAAPDGLVVYQLTTP